MNTLPLDTNEIGACVLEARPAGKCSLARVPLGLFKFPIG